MMSNLYEIIPGAERWPRFKRNLSEQFEARVAMVQIPQNPSIFLRDMQGSLLPIAVAHGEGRAEFRDPTHMQQLILDKQVALCFVDKPGRARHHLSPQPERLALRHLRPHHAGRALYYRDAAPRAGLSYRQQLLAPGRVGEDGPWLRMFRNARVWWGSVAHIG